MEQPTIKYPIVISRLTNVFCTCNHCGKLIPPKAGFTVCAICHRSSAQTAFKMVSSTNINVKKHNTAH